MILLDTNVIVYAVAGDAPQHKASRRLVEEASAGSRVACLFPQILLEVFAVVTDSRRMEKPAASSEGLDLIGKLASSIPVLHPTLNALQLLMSLVSELGVRRQQIFDSYLVAQMIDAGVDTICTYNKKDFTGYPITVLTPEEVLEGPDNTAPPAVHDSVRRRPKQ